MIKRDYFIVYLLTLHVSCIRNKIGCTLLQIKLKFTVNIMDNISVFNISTIMVKKSNFNYETMLTESQHVCIHEDFNIFLETYLYLLIQC